MNSIYSRIQEPFALPIAVFKKGRNPDSIATLYVPYTKSNFYKSTSGWSNDVYIKESSPMPGDTFTALISYEQEPIETNLLVTSEYHNEVQLGYGNKKAFPTGLISSSCNITSSFDGLYGYDTSISFTITSIGNNAFKDCTELTTLSIPNSIKIIENAFSGCTNLNSVFVNWRNPSNAQIDSKCFDDITR